MIENWDFFWGSMFGIVTTRVYLAVVKRWFNKDYEFRMVRRSNGETSIIRWKSSQPDTDRRLIDRFAADGYELEP